MNQLIFWGATGQARVLHDALDPSGSKLAAIFDNRKIESPFPDVALHVGREGFFAWKAQQAQNHNIQACVAIGGNRGMDRLELQSWLEEQGFPPFGIVHPRAFIATSASIGAGTQILAMSAVCANVTLGRAVIINTSATVDHDCNLGNGVHIAPGAHLAGEVDVDDFAFIGMGALILPRLRIGRGAVIGAGAVVTKNVAAGETVLGVPARISDQSHSKNI